jgi:lipoprotein-releasing system ATP-binding protein
MSVVLEIQNISRSFHQGGRDIHVLRDISLSLNAGEVVGLLGQSGSGKSTLLQIAGLLEKPDSGDVLVKNTKTAKLDDDNCTKLRLNNLGFVYQFHHLLPEFNAWENVAIPQRIRGVNKLAAKTRATELLVGLGLAERLEHLPSQMSGGEQQRVAIARALANKPDILLADEPTGNLDEATADRVMQSLLEVIHSQKVGAIIATHNLELASKMDRCFYLKDGHLIQS